MQIIVLPIYEEWGHALNKLDKPILAQSLEETCNNLKPSEPKSEVLVIEQPEDLII